MNPLLSLLARSLNEQGDVTGPLSFDDKLSADIRASALKHNALFTSDDLNVFVGALDLGDHAKVQRLDVASAEFLCFVLIHSEPCLAQQRGLYLLAAAIHTELSDEQGLKFQKFRPRRALRSSLSDLLKLFDGDSGQPELTRRYAAILALEILSGSNMGDNTLSNVQRKDLYSLGQTLTTAPSFSLRQLAGLLLHRLNTLGVPAKSFFASAELAKSFSNAVPGTAPNSQLLGGLANFCSDHGSLPVAFTSHVTIGNKSFVIGEEAGITISISKGLGMLTINIPPLPNTTAVYIDVPLESAELHNIRLSTKQEAQKKYVIDLSLKNESQASLSVNASPEHARRLTLGYTWRKPADDGYSTLKSLLGESTSPTEIRILSSAENLNASCGKMQYSVSSRGESEMSADLRMHSDARSKHMGLRDPVDGSKIQSEPYADEDLVECASTSPARGSTDHDGDSEGVLHGETASEFTDQDRNEMRSRARSAHYHHDQHSDPNGGRDSDEAQTNHAASSSPNSVKEQTESQLLCSISERSPILLNQAPIESSRRSPRLRRKAPSDPQLPTKAALKNPSAVKASACHAKQPAIVGAEASDEMSTEGLEMEAEPGPNQLQRKHGISQRKRRSPRLSAMPSRPSEADEARTGKGNAASKSIAGTKASTRNANTENANIGKARKGTPRKGEKCTGKGEREAASSPVAETAEANTVPTRSTRAAATQAKRKIEDQVSSAEASYDELMSSAFEPEPKKKRVRKSMPKKTSNVNHEAKVKDLRSRMKEHKARVVPLPTSIREHEPELEHQGKAPLIHFGKSGPQNGGLLKALERDSSTPDVRSTPRRPLAATAGNLQSAVNPSTPALPNNETREATTDSPSLSPCGESTPERLPPRVGSRVMIADTGSPILAAESNSASVQDENSPPAEEQDATAQLGEQGGSIDEEALMWEGADTTLVEPGRHVRRGENTLRQRDESSSSSSPSENADLLKQSGTPSSPSTSEDPDLLKQPGGCEPRQQKVYSALMEVVKQIDKEQRSKNARILEEVQDFQAYGGGLVHSFTRICRAELQSNEAKLKRAAKAQIEMFAETLQSISKDTEKILSKCAKDVEEEWRQEQEKMFAGIEALMAECEE